MRVTQHLPDNQIHFDYSLHQQKLEQVQSAKYLGIAITGVNILQKSRVKQLRQWIFFGAILALTRRHAREDAYATLVRPQLEYAAPI